MPLLWISLAFLCGIGIASLLTLATSAWLAILTGAGLLAGLAVWVRRRYPTIWARFPRWHALPAGFLLPVLVAALCLGAARYQAAQPNLDAQHIAWYNDLPEPAVVHGVIVAAPEARLGYTRLRLQAEQMRQVEELVLRPIQGFVMVQAPPGDWAYGDRVVLRGYLKTPSSGEAFDYRSWLARQGVFSQITPLEIHRLQRQQGNPVMGTLMALREQAKTLLFRLFSAPEAALLAGILLGDESALSEDVQEAFRSTGTAHLVAISGFNMTIISALALSLTTRLLGRWRGAAAAVVLLAGYTLLVGGQPPVVRAAIFGGLAVFGRLIGRQQQGLNSLAVASALIALFNPFVLWEVGFQLSVTATLGLILFAFPLDQALQNWLAQPGGWASRLPPAALLVAKGWLSEYFLFTLAAQVMTLPVLLYHFQEISWIGLLVNPFVLPVQPAVMILGGLAVLVGLIWQLPGQLLAWLAWPFVAYTLRIVELFENGNGVARTGPISWVGVLLMYGLLLALAARLRQPQSMQWPRLRPAVFLGILSAAAILTWSMVLRAPDGRLHLILLDTSQAGQSGDAILIQTPGGTWMLVNGGPSANRLSSALGQRLPAAGAQLDTLLVASVIDEQLQALPETILRYPPERVIWLGATHASYSARLLQAEMARADIVAEQILAGGRLDLGKGAQLRILAVTPRGGVLLLEWGNFRALLPLGVDQDTLESVNELVVDQGQSLAPVTALLLAEAGYEPANPPEWLARWQPQVALLSVAAGDQAGRPDAEVLEALGGIPLVRTDQQGWIELITDGTTLWLEREHK